MSCRPFGRTRPPDRPSCPGPGWCRRCPLAPPASTAGSRTHWPRTSWAAPRRADTLCGPLAGSGRPPQRVGTQPAKPLGDPERSLALNSGDLPLATLFRKRRRGGGLGGLRRGNVRLHRSTAKAADWCSSTCPITHASFAPTGVRLARPGRPARRWAAAAPRVVATAVSRCCSWWVGRHHRGDRGAGVGGLHRGADAGLPVANLTRVEEVSVPRRPAVSCGSARGKPGRGSA
jgi:hypothetical protein